MLGDQIEVVAVDYGGTLSSEDDEGGEVTPRAAAALRLIHADGYRLVLSSNTTPDNPREPRLAAAGVLDLFSGLVQSHELGYAKPHPDFYAAVIRAAGCPTHRILHVGNRLDKDVLAPLAMGMPAALLRSPLPPGATEIGDLTGVLHHLGIGTPEWLPPPATSATPQDVGDNA